MYKQIQNTHFYHEKENYILSVSIYDTHLINNKRVAITNLPKNDYSFKVAKECSKEEFDEAFKTAKQVLEL